MTTQEQATGGTSAVRDLPIDRITCRPQVRERFDEELLARISHEH